MKNYLSFILLYFVFSTNLSYSQNAIHVLTSGQGEPVLLLPGFANSSDVWEETLQNLNGNYQFHLVDYAGFNGLEPIEFPWIDKVKEELLNYITDNNLNNVTIIGHSLGGTLAIYMAAELQEHIQEIIIVDALPNSAKLMFPNQPSGTFSYENPFAKSQLSMSLEDFEQMITQQVNMMSNNKDKHNLIKEWILNTDRKTYVYGYIDYLNFDATPFLKNIDCKVTILSATSYGKEQSQKVYESQYKNLKDYKLKFAENSAHYIMFDQPDWFYSEINQILNNE